MGRTFEQVTQGEELPPLSIALDRARLVEYAAASGDRNPIHWDERFAKGVGLPDVIAHGMLTMGVAVEAVTAWAGDPAAVVEYSTRFTKPVVVDHEHGAQVEVTGTVKKLDDKTRRATVALTVTCGGEQVLGRALAVVALP